MSNKYTIVIPFQLPWSWSADYQRQTCLELSKKYKVIAYMNLDRTFILKALFKPSKKYPEHMNIKFYVPYDLIPFKRFKIVRELNDTLCFKIMEFLYLEPENKYLWIFDPIFLPLLDIFNGKTIYDCVDLISSPDKSKLSFIKRCEIGLIKRVSYFFVNSMVLKDKHQSIRTPDQLLPQGFNVDAYKKYNKSTFIFPKDKPIMGFIGGLNQRIDFKLFFNLVKRNPEWNFVLWGPVQDNTDQDKKATDFELAKLIKLNNFFTGVCANRNEVPSIVEQFDIGIIPYDPSQEFNKYCYPMKLFEYFYLQKPVISTPIKELERFSEFVKIETDVKGWEKQITYWLKNPLNRKSKLKIRKIAIDNSWQEKVAKILKAISYSG